ncbi:hypothetical protein Cs7R123_09600 [Catellatospora sp. TT07R-123]|uniref:hypothetical protein n=1 Tax=Catellatospora sp. TT07R-123 TaxID=2733863 RepID=UPI001B195551|nr:hypothetical protein [Catellatospora sp. TT07R-123]GHJ43618.1 hypothetical protein Cs7R123_09600 [Catellatospora sp. TT07R-123]
MTAPATPTAAAPPLALPADVPIALLPVRLETRYHDGKLLIRIYPDVLHVDTHETDLTAAETDHGVRYWAEVTAAGTDTDRLLGAWQALTAEYGIERAAWIARRTRNGAPAGTPATGTWNRAPLARLLPTRWRVAGYREWSPGQSTLHFDVAGKDIARDLAVGPDPRALADAADSDEQALVTPGMRWMVDYQAAVEAGMAITITRAEDANIGMTLTRLIVYGVDEEGQTVTGAGRLAGLLEAHHYTDGLGFADPGTPTNNTELARSGLDARSEQVSERYRLADGTRTAPAAVPGEAVGGQLAAALGFDAAAAAVLGRDPASRRTDLQADANALLWPSTWGYFLLHVLDGIDQPSVRQVRRHFIDFVRAGGALPTLRVGDQPYGVLPVMSLKHWADREGGTAAHTTMVRTMRQVLPTFTEASWKATVVKRWEGQPGVDPVDRYHRLLATQPQAVDYVGRSALGPEYVGDLWRFLRLDFDSAWRQAPRQQANEVLTALGLPVDQRHTGAVFAGESYAVPGALTGADPATYLAELLDMTPARLKAARERGQTPLLYRLARHSALLEWWNAAVAAYGGSRALLEKELVDVDPLAPPTLTLWRGLAQQAPGHPGQTVEQYLTGAPATDPNVADLREFTTRTRHLADEITKGHLPADALDGLVRGGLDLAAHRIDAWVGSFANRRLAHVRTRQPGGLAVGGFGWLSNVGPAKLTEVATLPPNEAGPLYTDAANAGHVLAPSLQHATTAAILHAGYVARGGRAGRPGAVAVNLNADRVRLVQHLTEGISAGQPLSSLIGYRFERALTEGGTAGAPAMILPFRVLAPYTAQVLTADGTATEVTRPGSLAGAVADGVELVRRLHAGTIPWGSAPDPAQPTVKLPAKGTPVYDACLAALESAADALDALADATLAEGVHHLAAGNPTRAGAVLDALAKGETPPPELDVVRTPRSGAVHTHRLMFLGTVDIAADHKVWPTDGRQLRADIEPTVNGWAGRLLGDPARVRCKGVWHGADGAVLFTGETTLDQLAISPLDLIALVGEDRSGGLYELKQRFIDRLRLLRPPTVPDEIMPEPDFGWQPGWTAQTLSVEEFLQLVGAVRATLAGARPVRAEDLAGPGGTRQVQWGVADMANRVTATLVGFTQTRSLLATAVEAGDIGGMGGHLVTLAFRGLPGAYPQTGHAWTDAWRDELRTKARGVLAEVDRRLAEEARLRAAFTDATATDEQRIEHHTARLRSLLGQDFPVAPTFRVTDQAGLRDLFAHSAALTGGDVLAPGTWLDRLARVRRAPARLQSVFGLAEATGAAVSTDLVVAQLPYRDGEKWAALPGAPATGRTALAVHVIRPVDAAASLAGLVFDEWTEMVPGESEVAGLTFHYDAPNSRAPQAVLLAVPPAADGRWTAEQLRDTVAEAFDLARARAVTLPTLDQYGHFLPAVYLGLNDAGATVSTDLTGAAGLEGATR